MILGTPPRVALLLVLTILLAPAITHSQEPRKSGANGPLDGLAFVGKLGPVDNPDRDDVLYFDEGHFWSSACTKCGFAPGVYWVRNVDGGIEFRGVLESPDRGRFSYLGYVRDGQIGVAINWRLDRWYWSIDRDLRFQGTRSQATDIAMTLDAARAAAGQKPPYPRDCPS